MSATPGRGYGRGAFGLRRPHTKGRFGGGPALAIEEEPQARSRCSSCSTPTPPARSLTLLYHDYSTGNGVHLKAAAGQLGHAEQGIIPDGERRDRATAAVPFDGRTVEDPATEMTSRGYLQRHGIKGTGSLRSAIRTLTDAGDLEQTGGKRPVPTDPLLATWVRERMNRG